MLQEIGIEKVKNILCNFSTEQWRFGKFSCQQSARGWCEHRGDQGGPFAEGYQGFSTGRVFKFAHLFWVAKMFL